MTSARTTPHDALVHWIAIADSSSPLEYSIDLSPGNEAIDGFCPVDPEGHALSVKNRVEGH
jgi:hypothetical protein